MKVELHSGNDWDFKIDRRLILKLGGGALNPTDKRGDGSVKVLVLSSKNNERACEPLVPPTVRKDTFSFWHIRVEVAKVFTLCS